MSSFFLSQKLVIATHNQGKLHEFRALLSPYFSRIVSAADLILSEPDETGTTFEANARLKAEAAAKASGCLSLADDSGLCVKALGGDPGLFSARWAGPQKDFAFAMQRIQNALEGTSDRTAYFVSVLCLAWPDGKVEFFEGRCDGTLIWPPRGTHGHGYDPIFVPEGTSTTFAEMSDIKKNAISHRGRVVIKFLERLKLHD